MVNISMKVFEYTRDTNGFKKPFNTPNDVGLFHELIHAIHDSANRELMEILHATPAADLEYKNLSELLTIAGEEEEYEMFALSENVYLFETGLPQRYGHGGEGTNEQK
jgi:hypothetical protein